MPTDPSLPVEQVKPMTDTTDTELEELIDEVEQATATYAIYQNTSSRAVVSLRLTNARSALRSYVSERTLSDADLGFLLSGEYGARNCPCQYCGALSKKLDAILKSPRNQGVPR